MKSFKKHTANLNEDRSKPVPDLKPHPLMKGIKHKHQVSAFNKSKTFVTVHKDDFEKAKKALGTQTAQHGGPIYLNKESVNEGIGDNIKSALNFPKRKINNKHLDKAIEQHDEKRISHTNKASEAKIIGKSGLSKKQRASYDDSEEQHHRAGAEHHTIAKNYLKAAQTANNKNKMDQVHQHMTDYHKHTDHKTFGKDVSKSDALSKMGTTNEAMDLHPDIANHPKVKDAQKQHKQGFWNGNVDKNGNAIVHVNGKPHTVTNTDTAARHEGLDYNPAKGEYNKPKPVKKDDDYREAKDTHCSDKCCGSDVKAEDCDCPADCPHCNCNADVSEIVDISRKNFTRPGTAKLNKALGKDKLKKDLEAMRAKLGKGSMSGPRSLRAGYYEEVEETSNVSLEEGPFKGIGKMMMKNKLNKASKSLAKQHAANDRDKKDKWPGLAPDQSNGTFVRATSKAYDKADKHGDDIHNQRKRTKAALDRLNKSPVNKRNEEVETLEELTAKEKQLVNQMYDKKGNLTPLGKKVFNHNKKPGDKGWVEHTSHAEKILGENAFDDLIADYLNENEITLHQYSELSEEEINEIIGKVIGGTIGAIGKGVVGAARLGLKGTRGAGKLAKKAVVNKQGNMRGTAAARADRDGDKLEKQVKQREMERAQRDRMAALKKRQDDAENDLEAKHAKQTNNAKNPPAKKLGEYAKNPPAKKLGELDVSTLKSYAKKANKARAKAANSYMDAAARRYDFDDESPHQKNQAKIFDKRDKGYELAQKKIKKS